MLPLAVMVAVGNAFTVTVVAADVAEQLFALVTFTEKLPLFFTVILLVVALLLHKYELPILAVKITESP